MYARENSYIAYRDVKIPTVRNKKAIQPGRPSIQARISGGNTPQRHGKQVVVK